MRGRLVAAITCAHLAVVGVAHAQSGDEIATAQAQFDRGLAAMAEKQFNVGCPALAESVRLDPRPGAIFTLAECEGQWGKLASAVAHYDDYLERFARMNAEQQATQRARAKIAEERSKALRVDVPLLTIELPADAPREAVVKRDGVELGRASLGVALPVDPGAHTLEVSVPGLPATERLVDIAPRQRLVVTLSTPHSAAPTILEPSIPPPSTPPSHGLRTAGYVSLGVGAVGLVVGAIGGTVTLVHKGTIDTHCRGTSCDRTGKDAADSAKSAAVVSSIGFGVAGVGAVTGLVFLLLQPSDPPPTIPRAAIDVSGDRATLVLRGAW